MKITLEDKKISFIPEHDKDCFDLGRLSKKVAHELKMISCEGRIEIARMEIPTNELWLFINSKIN
jgi:hypothetical protein